MGLFQLGSLLQHQILVLAKIFITVILIMIKKNYVKVMEFWQVLEEETKMHLLNILNHDNISKKLLSEVVKIKWT